MTPIKRLLSVVLVLLLTFTLGYDIFAQGDESALNEAHVEELLSQMTLEEKIGQMTLVEKNSIKTPDISALFIGGLLSGGGGYPRPNTTESWADMVNSFQEEALKTRLAIPLIYGVDAVHGHGNLRGATVFPHQIGLGATRNPELVEQIGRATAIELAATGIYWNYAPVVAVPQDIRWGRTYEAYSEDTALVSELATAYTRGLQGATFNDGASFVVGTPKHFVGDGGAVWGTSTTGNYLIDQGVTDVDETTLRVIHLPPYVAAIEAGARSIMISFSSWGGMKMHAQHYLITEVLKGELGFTGFVVSDWAGMDQITTDYYTAIVTGINAGVDMNMVPYNYKRFIDVMLKAVEAGDISQERIDDAVRRILRVKAEIGLFEGPFSDESALEQVGSSEHRALARRAVAESAVLLKNDNAALPITKDNPTIFVAGQFADDIGAQCGGWTIEWQGKLGAITEGTTILDGIVSRVGENVHYDRNGRFSDVTDANGNPVKADVGIVVVGETPYAEGPGDLADLSLSDVQTRLIQSMREQADTLVVILISGRPMIITEELELADAFVAVWLPGTEGAGVADVLFGDVPFTGKLPFTWPRSMDQVPQAGISDPLFPLGYGLE